jgi:pyruvate/2-oxoglutarate dehydrogenase complex dihydrolipoamide dehydrogenase (E3) component
MSKHYDYIAIGGGSGGIACAFYIVQIVFKSQTPGSS